VFPHPVCHAPRLATRKPLRHRFAFNGRVRFRTGTASFGSGFFPKEGVKNPNPNESVATVASAIRNVILQAESGYRGGEIPRERLLAWVMWQSFPAEAIDGLCDSIAQDLSVSLDSNIRCVDVQRAVTQWARFFGASGG